MENVRSLLKYIFMGVTRDRYYSRIIYLSCGFFVKERWRNQNIPSFVNSVYLVTKQGRLKLICGRADTNRSY